MSEPLPSAPAPHVMSLDRAAWRRQLHLSNFVNAAYQFRDVPSLAAGNKLLIIGPESGNFVLQSRRWTA